ncbi:hypothetical protein GR216_34715 [Rhizobium leguminosarum]|nr:hypothetical protein [Rhizobium ruizarguesonis]NEJ40207.1 hypothetical protein [Rhizobium ruizarguesonis]
MGDFEGVEFATPEWIDWFNHRRHLEHIGTIRQRKAEVDYSAMMDEPALVA